MNLKEENEKLREVLTEMRDVFLHYAKHHMDKVPPDIEKAYANKALADKCTRVLGK